MYLSSIKALPQIFESYFSSLDQVHNYNTRSKSNKNYFLDSVKTNSGKTSLKFKGVLLRNKMPSTLKSFSFYRYKNECKRLLWENYKLDKTSANVSRIEAVLLLHMKLAANISTQHADF